MKERARVLQVEIFIAHVPWNGHLIVSYFDPIFQHVGARVLQIELPGQEERIVAGIQYYRRYVVASRCVRAR